MSENTLIPKLVNVLKEITRLKKTGKNQHFNYEYATEADVLDAVRSKLAENGIFVFTSQEAVEDREVKRINADGREKISMATRVQMKHTFSDGAFEFSVGSFGESEDTGDKGLYKAVTGAMKYFVSKNFMISTGDDPETASPEAHGDRGARPVQSGETEFEDTILDLRERSGMSKQNKPYTAFTFITANHGEVQTVFADRAAKAKQFVGTGEIVLIQVDRSNPRYAPGLVAVALKE